MPHSQAKSGIAAGTPLAILGGIGRAARLGAIIKGGLYLETLGRIDTIVLDKTGTVTEGRMQLEDAIPADGVARAELLRVAGGAEDASEHILWMREGAPGGENAAMGAQTAGALAEREGFEPSMQVTPHGGLANRCTRPLCDLSVATAAGILSWAPLPAGRIARWPASPTAAITGEGPMISADLRKLLASMNPNLPIVTAQTFEDYASLGLVPQRVAASITASLGLVGLLLDQGLARLTKLVTYPE